jgi:hypothetical protein
MNTIDYFGKELVLRPINKVRVRFQDGKWNVEYRAKKWLINFWSVEGQYRDFVDAKQKAETLKAQGGFFMLQDMVLEMDVNTDVVEDPVADSFTQYMTSEQAEPPKKSWFARIFKRS